MGTFNLTKTHEPLFFTVNGEEFEALPAKEISASVLTEFFQLINSGDLFKSHDGFLKDALTEESYNRFKKRLNSTENAITVSVLGEVVSWLIGDEYSGSKSFGRSQAIINFALDYWYEFDSWCLMHGIQGNPWNLPSYRFGALVVAYMKDDRTQEGIALIEESLSGADNLPHPFADPSFRRTLRAMGGILSMNSKQTSTNIDNVIYDSRLTDLPIEERKRREAAEKGKPYLVPSWWKGEKVNYKVAQSMMKTVPKKIGPVKD